MENDFENAIAFGTLLSKNSSASAAYDAYTPDQRQAVLLRVAEMNPESIDGFVSSLSQTAP